MLNEKQNPFFIAALEQTGRHSAELTTHNPITFLWQKRDKKNHAQGRAWKLVNLSLGTDVYS